MRKQILTLALASAMSVGAVIGASAAGVGYVNMDALMQAHPKMAKAELDIKAEYAKKHAQFEKELAALKDDEAKIRLSEKYQRELAEKQHSLIDPLYKDVMKAIEKVRQEKGLDAVLDQGAVVAGGQDITAEVGKKL